MIYYKYFHETITCNTCYRSVSVFVKLGDILVLQICTDHQYPNGMVIMPYLPGSRMAAFTSFITRQSICQRFFSVICIMFIHDKGYKFSLPTRVFLPCRTTNKIKYHEKRNKN